MGKVQGEWGIINSFNYCLLQTFGFQVFCDAINVIDEKYQHSTLTKYLNYNILSQNQM